MRTEREQLEERNKNHVLKMCITVVHTHQSKTQKIKWNDTHISALVKRPTYERSISIEWLLFFLVSYKYLCLSHKSTRKKRLKRWNFEMICFFFRWVDCLLKCYGWWHVLSLAPSATDEFKWIYGFFHLYKYFGQWLLTSKMHSFSDIFSMKLKFSRKCSAIHNLEFLK